MQTNLFGNVLIVAGPRNYYDRAVISDALVDVICDIQPVKILTGDAKGVDQIVAELCFQTGIEYEQFPANWDKYGRSAGPRRNYEMALHGTHLLAFYNGSPGTSSMIYFAERHDLKVIKVNI